MYIPQKGTIEKRGEISSTTTTLEDPNTTPLDLTRGLCFLGLQ